MSIFDDNEKKLHKELPGIISAACTLISVYNREMSALAYINSIILLKGGAKKSALSRLNATKICMSYQATLDKASEIPDNTDIKLKDWQTLVFDDRAREKNVMDEISNLQELEDTGAILTIADLNTQLQCLRLGMHPGYYIVGDNVDMRTHARYHRLSNHDQDAHMFQMAAYKNRVPANHLEPNTAQGHIKLAPFSLVIPSEEDLTSIANNVSAHVAQTWIKYLKPFKDCEIPEKKHDNSHYTTRKTERISLGVINKCESKNDEMMEIVQEVHKSVPGHQEDESQTTTHPVRTAFEGDYLTFERAKIAQMAKRNGRSPSKQRKGILPRTAEFHNQAEVMKAIWQHLYSKDNAVDVGTLYNTMSLLEDTQVGDEPFRDYYSSSYLLDKFTVAYAVCGMISRDGEITQNRPEGLVNYKYVKDQAEQFVEEFFRITHFDADSDAPRSLHLVCQNMK
jgi:hypothetical protein